MKALLEQRHKIEKQFSDDAIRKKYKNISNYKLSNNLDYQQLFSRIQQFKDIVDFFADVSRILNRLDDFLLTSFPFLNRYYRLAAIYVVKG